MSHFHLEVATVEDIYRVRQTLSSPETNDLDAQLRFETEHF